MNILNNTALILGFLIFLVPLSSHGAYVHTYVLVPETTVTIGQGTPHTVEVDLTEFKFFKFDNYNDPPQRLTISNIERQGIYSFVLFENLSIPVPDYFSNLTDTYSTYWGVPIDILNESHVYMGTNLYNENRQTARVVRLNVTGDSLTIDFLSNGYENVRLAFYYEGANTSTFNYRIDQLDRFTYLFEEKQVQIPSGSYWTEIISLNLTSFLAINVTHIAGQGSFSFVFLSNTDEAVYGDYSQYFKSYRPEKDPYTKKDVYYNDERDKLVLFTLDDDWNTTTLNVLFNYGNTYIYDFPPDDKPLEVRLLIYFSGNDVATLSLDAYQFPHSPIIPHGSPQQTFEGDTPIAFFVTFFALGTLLFRKRIFS